MIIKLKRLHYYTAFDIKISYYHQFAKDMNKMCSLSGIEPIFQLEKCGQRVNSATWRLSVSRLSLLGLMIPYVNY